jgi:ribokinase
MSNILVIGSINMDIVMQVDRFPEKGENLLAHSVTKKCGGKGENCAIAVRNLTEDVDFIGAVGDDDNGKILLQNLKKHKISTDNMLISKEKSTGTCYIPVDKNGDNYIIVDLAANELLDGKTIREKYYKKIVEADLIMIQLEIALSGIEEIIKICRENKKKLVIDAGPVRDLDVEIFRKTYLLSPNETELAHLLKEEFKDLDDMIEKTEAFRKDLEIENIVVKLGSKGSVLINDQGHFIKPAYKVKVVDSTAAGDSFMAGLIYGIYNKKSMMESIEIATKCGAICVTRLGAVDSLTRLEDLENFEDFLIK